MKLVQLCTWSGARKTLFCLFSPPREAGRSAGLSSRFAGNGSQSVTERNAAWGLGRTKVWDLGSPDGRCGGITEMDAGELEDQALRP